MTPSIEEVIGYQFRNPETLREALTHKSFAFERDTGVHNERLEFLGDSVLSVIVARLLFDEHPEEDEGRLSKHRASLVSRASLAKWAESIDLGPHLRLGSGEESTGGRTRPSLLGNALEAIIGAVYVDGGFDAAYAFVHRCFLDERGEYVESDFKSRLQELVQKRHQSMPEYAILKATGPDHDKTFHVEVTFGAKALGEGSGKTKKEAEQEAARDALQGYEKKPVSKTRKKG
ncbi:MAG: ribonuclease III [Elusimicrobia bacterium]|nr:MAG: ribonuclease III [Elusimicrobiota bacterium]